jgi:hypothetical protein
MSKQTLWIPLLIIASAFCTNVANAVENDPNKGLNGTVIDAQAGHEYDGYKAEMKAVAAGTCPVRIAKDFRQLRSGKIEPVYLSQEVATISEDANGYHKQDLSLLGYWINPDGILQVGTTWQDYKAGKEVTVERTAWHKDIRIDFQRA